MVMGGQADSGVGAIRMDLDDSQPLQVPVIPIKPNDTIPLVVGVLLIIGSLWFAFSAYSNLFGAASSDPADYEEFEAQLTATGEDVSAEEIAAYFQALESKNYFLTLGIIESISTLLLLIGGILLIKKEKNGVLVGGAGGALALIDGFVGFLILSTVEAPSEWLSISLQFVSGLAIFCGLLCMLLPMLPMMLAAGRASLEQNSVAKEAMINAELQQRLVYIKTGDNQAENDSGLEHSAKSRTATDLDDESE
jgi:hypothetical protein